MSKLFDNIAKVVEKIHEAAPGDWEPGDIMAAVCKDGVVIVEMLEDQGVDVKVVAGEPLMLPDMELDLLEK